MAVENAHLLKQLEGGANESAEVRKTSRPAWRRFQRLWQKKRDYVEKSFCPHPSSLFG